MKAVWIVLVRGLVVPFYKQHGGLLFVVFLLMFGVVESTQIIPYHTALIHATLNSKFLILVMIFWVLYCIKCLAFLLKTSKEIYNPFLNALATLSATQSYWYFLGVSLLCFIPVLGYTIFIYGIAATYHYWNTGLLVFISQLSLQLIMALVLNNSLRNQHKTPLLTIPSLKLPAFNNLFGIYVSYLLSKEKLALLISKSLSLVMLYLVRETLVLGDDNRIMGLAWLFALMTHTLLISKLKTFEDHQLTWQLGFPIPVTQRYLTYLMLYFVLLIPELLLIGASIGKGLTLDYTVALIAFTIGFLTFIHCYLYKSLRNKDRFINYLLWLFLFSFILILSKLIWVAAVFYLVISYWMLQKRFFAYEKTEN